MAGAALLPSNASAQAPQQHASGPSRWAPHPGAGNPGVRLRIRGEMAMTTQVAPVVGQDRAQDLMRLGWAIAELRGRVYFRPADPGCIAGNGVARFQHSLPLY